jgi:hypothetical protein
VKTWNLGLDTLLTNHDLDALVTRALAVRGWRDDHPHCQGRSERICLADAIEATINEWVARHGSELR